MKHSLVISETFYSIQGEGPSVGTPAVFLRLAGCNLRCNGFSYQDPLTGEQLGCDTKAVWRKGTRYTFDDLISLWQTESWLKPLQNGAHLVITGGEPLIQQPALVEFLALLDKTLGKSCFVEMETNATFNLLPELAVRLNQINASPKLSNSGEALQNVYTQEHMEQFTRNPKVIFKFVIATPQDVEEAIHFFVTPLQLKNERVFLMAEGGTNAALDAKEAWLVEACKTYGFQFSPRLHIRIWGEVTGV